MSITSSSWEDLSKEEQIKELEDMIKQCGDLEHMKEIKKSIEQALEVTKNLPTKKENKKCQNN